MTTAMSRADVLAAIVQLEALRDYPNGFSAPAAQVAAQKAIDTIAALEAERDAAYARGLEDAARLVETIVVSGPEDEDVDHDDYRDTQMAAAIRALAQKGE